MSSSFVSAQRNSGRHSQAAPESLPGRWRGIGLRLSFQPFTHDVFVELYQLSAEQFSSAEE